MYLWHIKKDEDLAVDNLKTFNFYKNLFSTTLQISDNNFLSKHINKILKPILFKIKKNISSEYNNFLSAYSKINDIPFLDLILAVSFPDIFSYFLSTFGVKSFLNIPNVFLGCSTAILETEEGVIHSRNLDYFGSNTWADNHSVISLSNGKSIPSINITTKGLPAIGITSVNEHGISLSIHMLFTTETSLSGNLIMDMAYQIITKAKNISEVKKILENKKAIAGWAVIAYSHKEKRGLLTEFAGKHKNFIEITKLPFVYNNFYMSESLKRYEFYPSYLWIQNNFYRNKKLTLLAKKISNMKSAVNILSNVKDYYLGNKEFFGHSIANPFTVSSAIINFQSDKILIGENSCPASVGLFKEYNISEILEGKLIEQDTIKTNTKREEILDSVVKSQDILYNTKSYENLYNSLKFIEKSKYPGYFPLLLKSISLFKNNDFIKAKDPLIAILDKNHLDKYRSGLIKLLLANIEDFTGRKKQADHLYKEILSEHNIGELSYLALTYYTKRADKKFFNKVIPNFFLSHYIIT